MIDVELPLTPWQQLVALCVPTGYRVCDCGEAYEKQCKVQGTSRIAPENRWKCPGGCATAHRIAQDIVAKTILTKREQRNGA